MRLHKAVYSLKILRISICFEIKYNTYLIVYYKMPDLCQTSVSTVNKKKTYLQFLRHLIFQFGIVCLCFLTASHKVSGLILLDDGSSYSFMSIMIFFFCKIFQNALGSRHVVE